MDNSDRVISRSCRSKHRRHKPRGIRDHPPVSDACALSVRNADRSSTCSTVGRPPYRPSTVRIRLLTMTYSLPCGCVELHSRRSREPWQLWRIRTSATAPRRAIPASSRHGRTHDHVDAILVEQADVDFVELAAAGVGQPGFESRSCATRSRSILQSRVRRAGPARRTDRRRPSSKAVPPELRLCLRPAPAARNKVNDM